MGKRRSIGLFLISRATGYQNLMAEEGTRAAARLGIELEVFSSDDTAARQSSDIIKFLHSHADDQVGVVVMPVSDVGHEQAVESLARRVLSKGAAWLVLNRDLENQVRKAREEFPSGTAALVTIDNLEIGRIQARQVSRYLPPQGGTVLYVMGNSFTSAARDRRRGLLELLEPRGVSVHQMEGLWSQESAERVAGKWLAGLGPKDRLDAVVCQNDPMALGAHTELARLAVESKGRDWLSLPVLGVDGAPQEGRRLVDEGRITATVIVPATSATAIEMLAGVWDGRPAPQKLVLPATPHPAASAAS